MNESNIDRYLLNLLTSEEKIQFEKRLTENQEFARDFAIQKQVIEDIEGMGRLDLKARLKEIHTEVIETTPSKTTNIKSLIIRIASAAVFIGMMVFAYVFMQKKPTNTEIYAQHYEPYELSLSSRSADSNSKDSAEKLYTEGAYSQAIPIFQDILSTENPSSSPILMGLGIAFMETGQTEKAIQQFEQIITNEDFNYEDEALWYLSLAYIKKDDLVNAKAKLEILATDKARDHHEEALKILKSLK